ncbi:hypothetical protein QM467_09390, partial [Rhodoblastus sp. 17X3]|nr:hypothetical protein [Rhodoblastus sp. 17X3]
MLMTLDQWLARFFGAGRRADRPAPLSQRASFGLDGMEMRQIDSNFELQEWDEEPESEPSPYRPHFRRPRAVFVDSGQDLAPRAPVALPPAEWAPPAPPSPDYPPQHFIPAEQDDRARLEAMAAQKSREILAASQIEPQFQSDIVVASPQEGPAPKFWRADQPNVRFTRTPQASIARRLAEEEAQRSAAEEEARRIEEEARLKAEEQARRLEESRLAQSYAIDAPKPRVRYARTPDRVMQERNGVKPQPEPEKAAEIVAAPEPIESPAPESLAPASAAPVAAQNLTSFGAFGAMGARFTFSVGFGGISAPAPAPAPAPAAPEPVAAAPIAAETEKPTKMRLRVKAVAAPLEAAPEPVRVQEPNDPARIIRRVKPANGFLERLDFDATQYEPLSVETLAMPPVQPFEEEPEDQLEVNADALEKTLEDFGVRGDVLNA